LNIRNRGYAGFPVCQEEHNSPFRGRKPRKTHPSEMTQTISLKKYLRGGTCLQLRRGKRNNERRINKLGFFH